MWVIPRADQLQDGWKGPELFHNILGNLMGVLARIGHNPVSSVAKSHSKWRFDIMEKSSI